MLSKNKNLYSEIKEIIEDTRKYIAKKVNSSMTMAYWSIGKIIKENLQTEKRAEYGKETLKKLSQQLTHDFGNGFSYRNILRMVNFYEFIPEKRKVTTLSSQLTWSHFVELLKLNDQVKREFYIAMCKNENWTVRTLRDRMNSLLYERTAISKMPETTIIKEIEKLNDQNKMNPSLFLRDPYILDFLELKNNYSEKDLENAILEELENFILEFGNDFAFLARQKRIQIGNNDYYIDLLFYHRKLRRLILIELKLGDFKPDYKGQVELYLKWLSKNEKQDFEEEPIAIILCSGKDNEVIEIMELEKDNIHVSEYWLKLPPKNILMKKLHQSIKNAKAIINNSKTISQEVNKKKS
jgi:predicted nuclease of restriction endonuclease-like (RecB) superfamily